MTERNRKGARKQTLEKQKGLILAPYLDMIENGDPDGVADLAMHAGITSADLDKVDSDIAAAVLAHYRKKDGSFDIDAAAHDLRTFPPIAARLRVMKEMNSNSHR